VNAIGEVNLRLAAAFHLFDLVDRRRAEILARIAKFRGALLNTDVQVEDVKMWRLVFIVLGS
jgi:hypothetical protein